MRRQKCMQTDQGWPGKPQAVNGRNESLFCVRIELIRPGRAPKSQPDPETANSSADARGAKFRTAHQTEVRYRDRSFVRSGRRGTVLFPGREPTTPISYTTSGGRTWCGGGWAIGLEKRLQRRRCCRMLIGSRAPRRRFPTSESVFPSARIVYQNGGYYSCLERITLVVSGVRDAVAECYHQWWGSVSDSQAPPTQTACHGTAPC